MGIAKTTRLFEKWLSRHTPLIAADLERKHTAMAESSFQFFRATFYRWVQRWHKLCPNESKSPKVLAVGDLHVENFGTWRDDQGRMVYGINDFDEAFPLSYSQDLIRLASSALLAVRNEHLSISESRACRAILDGYRESLTAGGRPIIVDEEHRWLAPLLGREVRDPVQFWQKMRNLPAAAMNPPASATKALRSVLPPVELPIHIAHRVAGLGSLGKQRFVALAEWRGGPIARETKPLTPSAAAWAEGTRRPQLYYAEILQTGVRCLDPLFTVRGAWVARRLAPDCCRIELASLPHARDDERLLRAMGWETANVHLGSRPAIDAVSQHIKRRRGDWLERAAVRMLADTMEDWNDWREKLARRATLAQKECK